VAIEVDDNNRNKFISNKREKLLIFLSFTAMGISYAIYGFKIVTHPYIQLISYILGLSMIILGMGSWKYKWIELG